MTEAEKIAVRAKIFQSLGLSPDGMCKPAFPILSNIEKNQDAAYRSIMSSEEVEACEQHEVRPSDYIIARGVVKPSPVEERPQVFSAANDPMVEMTRESLAKYCAGVGGKRNRDHLFAAQAAIQRMLKRS